MRRFAVAAFALAFALSGSLFATAQDRIYNTDEGVTLPTVVKQVQPKYTTDALKDGIQGTVVLAVVVKDDGSIGDVSVEESLDQELDQQAIEAMRQWEFKPGTKDGKPVAVRVRTQLRFTLK
jgi:TonB family protein